MNLADQLFPLHSDSVASVPTGLGVIGTDKARDARPAQPVWLTPIEAEDAGVVDTVIRRAVFAVPEYTVMNGWRTDQGGRRDTTAALDEALQLEARIVQLDQMARCYGGALGLMVCEGVEDLAKPLPPGQHDVVAFQVFTAREAFALAPFEGDLRSADWARPAWWSINPLRQGLGGYATVLSRVHRSHLIYMPGLPHSPSQIIPGMMGYDLSVPQAYWERARDLGLAMRSAALAAMEQSMLVLNIKGGVAAKSADSPGFRDKLAMFDQGRSTRRAAVLMGEDQAYRLEAPLSGMSDIVRTQYELLAAVEGFPLSWLLGLSPAGLSTDDASGRRTVEQLIVARRRTRIVPALRRIHEVALGKAPREYWFGPVFPQTLKERAEISLLLAQRDMALGGAIGPDESRGRLHAEPGEEEAFLPVLLDDADEPAEDEITADADIIDREG